ncbi:hypothetical protein L484_005834 [Morus notabilis]|uniref:Uncharacterized protein n=1 Tax=Morus notabilis TaxID=981085 RepID=W9QFB7_9ROSA|nr:hypothetical protein L484_005834 [Morus notabilis]
MAAQWIFYIQTARPKWEFPRSNLRKCFDCYMGLPVIHGGGQTTQGYGNGQFYGDSGGVAIQRGDRTTDSPSPKSHHLNLPPEN